LNGARINSVCISKLTRDCFITGDSQNNVKFYEFDAESESFTFNSSPSTQVQSEVSAVSFNTEDRQIYAGSNRGIIHIWDI
jgi:WD40 repeat protein